MFCNLLNDQTLLSVMIELYEGAQSGPFHPICREWHRNGGG
jgi:hypothetical protein